MARIYAAIEQNYADPADADIILEGAVRGILSSLDPFSSFFNRDQFEQLQQQTRGEALGFGSILYVQPGKVTVLQAAEGSPSWRAGLGPGDEIVSVNGTRLGRLDFDSVIGLLKESRSHPVRLGVIHPGRLVAQDFELKPTEVALPTIDKAFELSPGVAYLHVSGFEQKTAQEIADALTRLGGPEASKLKGVLLDLRDNHGGLLEAALGVASLFLKPELPVLTVRGRTMPEKTYKTESVPLRFDSPLIVLVNGFTASAAEVVTAALQEHERALVAGEPTFGKGVVEGIFPLSEKTGLALTTAQYFTSSGRSIQRPLPGTALAEVDSATERHAAPQAFHTDSGRPVSAGGGVTPDVTIPPRSLDPWVAFLNQRGLPTNFASQYLSLHGKVDPSFSPDDAMLADFKDFLTRQQIRTPDEYWKKDQDYLKLRIKTEIFNLSFGLTDGDAVEVRGDPQVQKAAGLFASISELLSAKPGAAQTRPLTRR